MLFLPDNMDPDYVKNLITPAVNTLLEMSLEGSVDIEVEPDLYDLVVLAYPNYTPGANMAQCGIEVYIVNSKSKDGATQTVYRIGEDRAFAFLKHELNDEDIADVQVSKLGEND